MMRDHLQLQSEPKSFWGSRYSFGLIVLGAVAAYFLLTEHRAHLFAALPLLLLFGCLGMHVFMHHGHGGHDSHRDGDRGDGAIGHQHGRLGSLDAPVPQQDSKKRDWP